ncbi:hypothetical protein VNO77_01675 [Canavalia gladiata]|uniref:Uncharacterized protein n=1 Tax=Canavalia gladiata TaxID=3824 RepID=A0AAN9MS97_CANGL
MNCSKSFSGVIWQGDNVTQTALASVIPFQGHFHIIHSFYSMAGAGQFLSLRFPKPQLWKRCSRHFQEQKTRFYIIWRCIMILLRWQERS